MGKNIDLEDAVNADPITGEPGSHPVGTGVGAAGGAVAGAAIGSVIGGPIGAVVGTAIGAATGAGAGHMAGEAINPTLKNEYWASNYNKQRYVDPTRPYASYEERLPLRLGVPRQSSRPQVGRRRDRPRAWLGDRQGQVVPGLARGEGCYPRCLASCRAGHARRRGRRRQIAFLRTRSLRAPGGQPPTSSSRKERCHGYEPSLQRLDSQPHHR